ncbi:LysM peptidoglycan-binding domain-containing protein [Chondrinema litorale]|uniref:LysM peptidoglycan-binding domain-containing protein n=1 Tax=Chondrinema litorale TaxID=2994555 RepID=UPI0025438A78|nr:LysM peptidoglycan-binding domain-containing protein [Chondrinema litorale]UZR94953.1 LysM peptidoglycan-binding domain-containing protein [Chondrinema litorale]
METIRKLSYTLLFIGAIIFSVDFASANPKEYTSVVFPQITEVSVRAFGNDTVIFVHSNNIPAFIARPDQDLMVILDYMQLTPFQFSEFNDLETARSENLKTGAVYYLRKKNNKALVDQHIAKPGETMWDISQMYGVKLDKILVYNRIGNAEQMVVGQVLNLRKKKKNLPLQVYPEYQSESEGDPWKDLKKTYLNINEITPSKKVAAFEETSIETSSQNQSIYIASKNENIFDVSRKNDVTVLDIIKWNNLGKSYQLDEGSRVYVKNPIGRQEASPQNIFLESTQESDHQALITSNNTLIPSTNYQINSYLDEANKTRINYSAPLSEILNPSMINTLNHKVNKGEYVYKLSRVYEVVPEDIMEWNSLTGKAWLYENDSVLIKKVSGYEVNPRIHTVRKGETLYSITGKYGTTIKDITRWNQLTDYTIYPGQDLIVSVKGFDPDKSVKDTAQIVVDSTSQNIKLDSLLDKPKILKDPINSNNESVNSENLVKASNTSDGMYHKVEKDETIYQISAKYNQSVSSLRSWNNIPYGTKLKEGQKIIVKKQLNDDLD